MKRILAILVLVVIIGGIIFWLLHNKKVSEQKAKNDVLTAPAVMLATVTGQQLADTLILVGTTVASNDVNIVSEAVGRIVAVHVNAGDHVTAGAPLYQVDDELKRAAVETAQANNDKAKKDWQRYESLKQEKSITDATYEAAKLAVQQTDAALIVAKKELKNTSITSPIAGVVTTRLFDLGAYVQSGTVVANVVDVAKLKVKINVAEKDAFRLHDGDKVTVTTEVYPGEIFYGTISSISAKGDEGHTYPVEVVLPNSATHPLKAGMFARLAFSSLPQHEALTIPRAALVGSILSPQVFVVENNTAHLRDIVVGSVTDTWLAVSKGLNAGERVVVSGQNNLNENASVTEVH